MAEKERGKKAPRRDEDEVDRAPPPQGFRPPRDLQRVPPADEFEVKSGAAPPAPPVPLPPGADVRVDKPAPRRVPRIPLPDDGPVDIRLPQPAAPRKLPPIEEPGPVDVILPGGSPTPKPIIDQPLDLGEVDVVIDTQRRAPLELGADGEPLKGPRRVGLVDTTFARFNMGDAAEDELHKLGTGFEVLRRTVPGVKDLPVECKVLLERYDCDLVLACGMVGRHPVDKQCAHEASLAIQWAQLSTNKHILEVFVHEDEARDERQLAWLMDRRTREHAENAWALLFDPERLRKNAGQGLRQGFDDAGPLRLP